MCCGSRTCYNLLSCNILYNHKYTSPKELHHTLSKSIEPTPIYFRFSRSHKAIRIQKAFEVEITSTWRSFGRFVIPSFYRTMNEAFYSAGLWQQEFKKFHLSIFTHKDAPLYLSKTSWKLHPTRRQTSTLPLTKALWPALWIVSMLWRQSLTSSLVPCKNILRARIFRGNGKNIDLKGLSWEKNTV